MDEPPDSTAQFVSRARHGFWARLFGKRARPAGDAAVAEFEERLRRGKLGFFLRRRGRLLAILAGVSVVGLHLWKGGPYFIKLAHDAHVACSNSNYDVAPGASTECEGHAARWLYPAMIVPWARADARREGLRIRASELETRMSVAAKSSLDPEPLRSTPPLLLEVVRNPEYPEDLRREDWVFGAASVEGDPEATLSLAEHARGGSERDSAIHAALATADLERAKALAAVDDPDPYGYDYQLHRGALLCGLGETAAGLKALGQAQAVYLTQIHSAFADASVAQLLCGTTDVPRDTPFRDAIRHAELFMRPAAGADGRRLDPSTPYEEQMHEGKLPFFAAWIVGGHPSPREVIRALPGLDVYVDRARTPWVSGGATVSGVFSTTVMVADAALLGEAADRLDALAATVASGELKLVTAKERDEMTLSEWTALDQPGPALANGAASLRLMAASICATRFDHACEAAFVAKLPPEWLDSAAPFIASDFARQGEGARARELIEKATHAEPATTRFYALLDRAMFELADGKKDAAYATAIEATQLLDAASAESGILASVVGPAERGSATWVVTATALAANVETVPFELGGPTYFEGDDLPKTWLAVARADDATRRKARWKMQAPGALDGGIDVLPA
ncbi:MAG TPA: hypothetical protein VL400_00025, partial [Polyangiaceae bacterium]|nr:hypothetical protein [Polyangiaceae bacterium]